MKLGAKGRYAVTAMVDLAQQEHGGPVALSDISIRQNLPLNFLEQLFSKLKKAGLVCSVRGQKGGYALAKAAEEITVTLIVQAVEESLKTTACTPGSEVSCKGASSRCLTHDLWAGLEREIQNYLSSVTLLDICEKKLAISLPLTVDTQQRPMVFERACP
jgi:Rrf2 family iron-sulfur cluster assembly transcriptional regulator